jgi:hypothetical protein
MLVSYTHLHDCVFARQHTYRLHVVSSKFETLSSGAYVLQNKLVIVLYNNPVNNGRFPAYNLSLMSTHSTTFSYHHPLGLADLSDRVGAMRLQENTLYKCCDYFGKRDSQPNTTNAKITMLPNLACRDKMVQWLVQVIKYYQISPDIVGITLSYVDRYLSIAATFSSSEEAQAGPLYDRKEYQLLCMTSLYVAMKINCSTCMSPTQISDLSKGHHSIKDITMMELDLLQKLGWHMCGPTPLDFIEHFIELSNILTENKQICGVLINICRHQIELAAANYHFIATAMSTIAISAMINAIEALGSEIIPISEKIGLLESIFQVAKINASYKDIASCQETLMATFAQFAR